MVKMGWQWLRFVYIYGGVAWARFRLVYIMLSLVQIALCEEVVVNGLQAGAG